MLIEVCSLERALKLAAETGPPTAVISITSKEEKDVLFPEAACVEAVLRLKFNDLWEEYDDEGIPFGRPLPRQEDFAGLKEFVAGLSCERLVVHCREGISRSAAVAKAIREYRGGADEMRTERPIYPNPLVFTLALRELGMT